ncbi:AP2/ERF and B3 domain-containing transcription factor ARF14 [Manihot esculenta]|uniref:TF-B3 domain-containing protein n=1 Tax=Manihot esculenta TaxID=3983 RepID=A0A2C9VHS1_MANES|nr:AP2/ERF and B3 domain-containing transcription factor ARF14 [Manihot esculenta]OAY44974.1 hypothetical protein MANES_07G021500v8 [Manihot esculenta]
MKFEMLFRKKLTDTDVKYRMVVPMDNYRDAFQIPEGDFSEEIDVIDMDDDSVKKFNCSKRRKGHPKPVFCKGWISFVKEKHLVAGDEVTFYKEEDETGRIRIKVQSQKIQCLLFGVDLRDAVRNATYFRQQTK